MAVISLPQNMNAKEQVVAVAMESTDMEAMDVDTAEMAKMARLEAVDMVEGIDIKMLV